MKESLNFTLILQSRWRRIFKERIFKEGYVYSFRVNWSIGVPIAVHHKSSSAYGTQNVPSSCVCGGARRSTFGIPLAEENFQKILQGVGSIPGWLIHSTYKLFTLGTCPVNRVRMWSSSYDQVYLNLLHNFWSLCEGWLTPLLLIFILMGYKVFSRSMF